MNINLHAEELIKQRDIIIKALVSKDLEETVASLNSVQFGEEISKAAALYNEQKNLQIFDTYFDKILFLQLGRALKNTRDRDVIKLVGMDIDFYNLLSVIRGKLWGLDEAQNENELELVAEFERSFEMALYNASARSFSKMFSFATIVGITKLTAFEVRNLAAIAYAVEQKIPTDVTMSKLIVHEE